MKKTFIFIFILFLCYAASAQNWRKNLPQNKTKSELTLPDYQKAFNDYWDSFNVKNGRYVDAKGKEHKAYGWKQFKRWEYFWSSRVNPVTGEFPKTTAYEQVQKFYNSQNIPKSANGNWTSLGTSYSDGGYAGIGRLASIAFHPTNDQIFWVGAPAGGLWVTTNGGAEWNALTDNNGVLGVSSIVIPSDYDASHTIYIGTGDRDASDNNSIGVLKSTDSGLTWNTTGLVFEASQEKQIGAMLMLPGNNQTIFAATTSGLYKTIDGATNWDLLTNLNFIDIEFKPDNLTVMYGSTRNGKIYKSIDSGVNWTQVFNTGSRIELAVSANNPSKVYALVAGSDNGLQGIYASTDAGDNFSLLYDLNILGWSTTAGGDSGGQGWYDLCLAADPNNANNLFCGGVNTWKSIDGGVTWTLANHWYGGGGADAVHADKHLLQYRNNTSILFEGNDGGVYKTNDGNSWTDLSNSLVISQMYRLGVSQTNSTMTITGLQDNGTKQVDNSTWRDVKGGDGMECIIDYTNENIQFGTYVNGQIDRTTNNWQSASDISANIPGGPAGAWVTPYVMDPNDHNTIYVGYSTLWKSTNQGNSFSSIGSFGQLISLAVATSNSQVIYAATGNSIKRTVNGGGDWISINSNLPLGTSSIKYITIKNDDQNTAWVSLSGYNADGVYQTTDGGLTWTNISQGLLEIPVNCVVQNKLESATQLYAATDFGIYIKNGSSDWVSYSNNLPNVVVAELEIYYDIVTPANSRLRAATYGRGLWESDLQLSGAYSPMLTTGIAENITTTSATVNAEIDGDFGSTINETGFIYSTSSDLLIGNPGVSSVQTNPATTTGNFSLTLSALESGGKYFYRAYAINANGTGYGTIKSFTTNCVAVSSSGWIEGFENGLIPNCWSESVVSGNPLSWTIESGNGNGYPAQAHTGTYNALLKGTSSTSSLVKLTLPMMSFIPADVETILSFWHTQDWKFGSYKDFLKVFYKLESETTWTELASYSTAIDNWTLESVTLPFMSENFQIAFEGNAMGGNGVCIDDILFTAIGDVENISTEQIKLHPNPTTGIVNVQTNNFKGDVKYAVKDVAGKIIMTGVLNNSTQKTINLSKASKGMYFIHFEVDNKTIVEKIVRQ